MALEVVVWMDREEAYQILEGEAAAAGLLEDQKISAATVYHPAASRA